MNSSNKSQQKHAVRDLVARLRVINLTNNHCLCLHDDQAIILAIYRIACSQCLPKPKFGIFLDR